MRRLLLMTLFLPLTMSLRVLLRPQFRTSLPLSRALSSFSTAPHNQMPAEFNATDTNKAKVKSRMFIRQKETDHKIMMRQNSNITDTNSAATLFDVWEEANKATLESARIINMDAAEPILEAELSASGYGEDKNDFYQLLVKEMESNARSKAKEAAQGNFMQLHGLNNRKMKIYTRFVMNLFNRCQKMMAPGPATVVAVLILRTGLNLNPMVCSGLLRLFGASPDHHHLVPAVQNYHSQLHSADEMITTQLVRYYLSAGDIPAALAAIDTLEAQNMLAKPRTYQAILQALASADDTEGCLSLLQRMQSPGRNITVSEEDYMTVAACIVRISAKSPLGLVNTPDGPRDARAIVDDIVTTMSALTISVAESQVGDAISAAKMGPFFDINRVMIPRATGQCPETGVHLRQIVLSKAERDEFRRQIKDIADCQYETFLGRDKLPFQVTEEDRQKAAEEMEAFVRYLDIKRDKPFTAVVDAANVAYRGQNYEDGGFRFNQVKAVTERLVEMGENVLIVIPEKYTWNYWKVVQKGGTKGGKPIVKRQYMEKEDRVWLKKLMSKDMLYVVPRKCLDDHFWMLASVSEQKGARSDLGYRPLTCITNDLMRDHQVSLLERLDAVTYHNWIASVITSFGGGFFYQNESKAKGWESKYVYDPNEITFQPPDPFSRIIQKNEDDFGNAVWHIPVREIEETVPAHKGPEGEASGLRVASNQNVEEKWICIKMERNVQVEE